MTEPAKVCLSVRSIGGSRCPCLSLRVALFILLWHVLGTLSQSPLDVRPVIHAASLLRVKGRMSTGSEKSCSLEKNNSRTALNSNPFECQKEGRVFSLLPVDLFRYSGQVLDLLGKRSFLGKAAVSLSQEEFANQTVFSVLTLPFRADLTGRVLP